MYLQFAKTFERWRMYHELVATVLPTQYYITKTKEWEYKKVNEDRSPPIKFKASGTELVVNQCLF